MSTSNSSMSGLYLYVFIGLFLILLSCTKVYALENKAQHDERLRINFYQSSCPNAESIARQTLLSNLLLDPTAPAALLRLVFHDCQVQGCDGSILLQSTSSITSELVSERNFGIRRLDFIDRIKAALEAACPNTVSCADIIVMAASNSVAIAGGPNIPIETGRRDTRFSSNLMADKELPSATISVSDLLQIGGTKGLDTGDSVAILGAHTLGVGHCINFANRLQPQDPSLSPPLAAALNLICRLPAPATNLTFAANDLTNLIFDNQYFRDLQGGRGLLTIDSELMKDPRTQGFVNRFAADQNFFFQKFSEAFVKLTRSNVLTGTQGEIRNNCKAVN
ncbi:hypothetical protein O6H91_07G068400 [Diphasiastrum complanatum]|uniref:Uncharacterized protein n=1 Tax=Diphasiastrum complanatum TaxID=34168 RepID=A0ACC2D6E2_DIPCM|nr:hypothetical protein O6H91_Y550800 [Diphasiastrum complanatum]KAJ7549777.1 hypothetical protein O6H91_07G068400 [Diphasiastrum complanatum]